MEKWILTDEEYQTLSVRNKRFYNKAHTYILCSWDDGPLRTKDAGFKILVDLGWEEDETGELIKPDFSDVLVLNEDNFVVPKRL